MKNHRGTIHVVIALLALILVLGSSISGCQFQGKESGKNSRQIEIGGVTPTEAPKQSHKEYHGKPYAVLQNNKPSFSTKDYKTKPFEKYSSLDSLGRCQTAYANICKEIMPREKRGAIGMIKPSGWHTVKYDVVDGRYLYNRCHLIGYQLAGENANEKNLITGTRYMNVEGMLPFEEEVAEYVKRTGNHVLYRVTPKYEGDNLLAEGVEMEAYSVEDNGEGVCFHVFVYNVQPGVKISYNDGASALTEDVLQEEVRKEQTTEAKQSQTEKANYIINKNTRKFHRPDCSSAKETLPKNRKKYYGSRGKLLKQGYEPCGRCRP